MMTQGERAVYDLKQSGLGFTEIARTLGVSRRTVRTQYERAVSREETDPGTQTAMAATGVDLIPHSYWKKTKDYSVYVQVPKQQVEDNFLDRLRAAFEGLPAAPRIPLVRNTNQDLMTVYPIFDFHYGLRATKDISGEDYSCEIAAQRLIGGISECMATCPDSYRGVIINGGDFTHADDDENVTPANKHVLDVDCRNYDTIDGAIEVISAAIELALSKHKVVEYYSVPGNHDPKNWVSIMFALAERYRNNPRVMIEKSPIEFSIIQHGESLLVIHHGHKRDVKEIIMWFAAAHKDIWSRTEYRMIWTGHKHGWEAKDFPGMTWEQMRAVTAKDHYAASAPYASKAELQAVTFDLKGERNRTKVQL